MAFNSNAARSFNVAGTVAQNNRPEILGYLNISIPRKNGTNAKITGAPLAANNAAMKALHDFLMQHIDADTPEKAYEALRDKLIINYVPLNQEGQDDLDL